MQVKRVHLLSGIILASFIGLHFFNHLWGILGAKKHIEMMETLRHLYRNVFVEIILLASVTVQLFSGVKLFKAKRKGPTSGFEKIQLWTGLYLAFFLVIHLSAVLGARCFLQIDTNFYFGVAGINTFPLNLFFIPYYALAVLSVFGHIAAIHSQKVRRTILGLSPAVQGKIILILGLIVIFVFFYGFTNGFKGVAIPEVYKIL